MPYMSVSNGRTLFEPKVRMRPFELCSKLATLTCSRNLQEGKQSAGPCEAKPSKTHAERSEAWVPYSPDVTARWGGRMAMHPAADRKMGVRLPPSALAFKDKEKFIQ